MAINTGIECCIHRPVCEEARQICALEAANLLKLPTSQDFPVALCGYTEGLSTEMVRIEQRGLMLLSSYCSPSNRT